MNKLLEDNLIKLRALEPEDIDLLYDWENNTELWYVSETLVPFSKHVLEQYIETAHLDIYDTKQLRLMIDIKPTDTNAKPRTIGSIDLFDFDPFHLRAGVGILIHQLTDRQHGYASHALSVFINYAFNWLQLHQLYCNIGIDNEASIKLFKNHGFQIIGNKKQWRRTLTGWSDEYMLQLMNREKFYN